MSETRFFGRWEITEWRGAGGTETVAVTPRDGAETPVEYSPRDVPVVVDAEEWSLTAAWYVERYSELASGGVVVHVLVFVDPGAVTWDIVCRPLDPVLVEGEKEPRDMGFYRPGEPT